MATVVKPSMLSLTKRYLTHRRKMGFALKVEGDLLLDFAHRDSSTAVAWFRL